MPGSTGLSFTQALHDEVLTLGRAPPSEGASSGAQTGLFGHIVVTLALRSCSQCSGWFFNESKEIPLKISVGGFFEEKAILITILCKQFLSVFVILEDVQAVTDTGLTSALQCCNLKYWGYFFFTAYGHKIETFP